MHVNDSDNESDGATADHSGTRDQDTGGETRKKLEISSFKHRMMEKRHSRKGRMEMGDNFNLTGALSIKLPRHASTDALHAMEQCCNGQDATSDNQLEDHIILLPHHHDPVTHFALDIGGTLIKMVYYESGDRLDDSKVRSDALEKKRGVVPSSPITMTPSTAVTFTESLKLNEEEEKIRKSVDEDREMHLPGGKICFARFRTADIMNCMSFIETLQPHSRIVHTTGGGAFKFATMLKERLGITIKKVDEMESLISGLNFLLKVIETEAFIYDNHEKIPRSFKNNKNQLYPYLLVNIGSGVSIIKVTSDKTYERVSGSSLGGGTFWGLCSMLTGVDSFEEMLEMTKRGDNTNVDMLVGDIYGQEYGKVGLAAETIASSCAKPVTIKNREKQSERCEVGSAAAGIPEGAEPKFSKEDISKSLLYAICNNISQIAYLNAMRFKIKRIFFAGYFIRDHPITMSSISFGIRYWSQGEMSALFLKHEGYLGAIGSFFKRFSSIPQGRETDSASSSPALSPNEDTI